MPIAIGLGISPVFGGGAGWTPAALGSSLIAWWTADRADLITASSNVISSWKDVKAGYDMVNANAAQRPLYSATGFNGAPCVSFDGADDRLTCTDAGLLALLQTGASPSEQWALVSQDAVTLDATRIICSYGGDASASRRGLQRNVGAQNLPATTTGNGSGGTNTTGTALFSGRHVIRGEFGATVTAVSQDGADRTTASITPNTQALRATLGTLSNSTQSNFWLGTMRDVLFIAGALSAADAASLQAYLQAKRLP